MIIENTMLRLTLTAADGTLHVLDKRTGQTWSQAATGPASAAQNARIVAQGLQFEKHDVTTGLDLQVRVQLVDDLPEVVVSVSSQGEMPLTKPMPAAPYSSSTVLGATPVAYPYPFVTGADTWLVVPMNEGISYPVTDPDIDTRRFPAYGGHGGICMAFYGATDGARGYMTIIETPDDAIINVDRQDGVLCVMPEWDAEKGRFGYTRRLRYVFFERGGHVAMCKRYRSYAQQVGLFKTLAEKRRENPDVDLLIGAVNVWYMDREHDPLAMLQEMRSLGIRHVLWSSRQPPEVLQAMNRMDGVLTSRYDCMQDLLNPDWLEVLPPGLSGRFWGNNSRDAWPKDLMISADGEWTRGWPVRGTDGNTYPCGVTCDRQAIQYERDILREELSAHPYHCRFLDTTTATPWRECYHPDHPMTRGDSRHWKMELLRLVSEEFGLVTGTETGHEASVPYVHYYEGMLSLAYYRVPDAGMAMAKIYHEVPERVAKFQLGENYRLPLWELVFHDCVVAQWYWGDYNNKLPALWDKRDLFNILYGTPPMFMFNREIWAEHSARFAKSYHAVCPPARDVGYAEMTDHRFLTPDRSVQQTHFANGTVITVNFGPEAHPLEDGDSLAPMTHRVQKL